MKDKVLILCVWGTRPEAIKVVSVVSALKKRPALSVLTCATAQHRSLLDQAQSAVGLRPNFDLNLMRRGQSLAGTAARVLEGVSRVLRRVRPDMVLVQGDTTTALAAALASFYLRIPVGHIEAGLRSHDLREPFPEEMHRMLVDDLAELHFAPTALAKKNLRARGVSPRQIFVTGNTSVDAVRQLRAHFQSANPTVRNIAAAPGRLLLLTAHRRESFGAPLAAVARALLTLVNTHQDIRVIYPVHPNPEVLKIVVPLLRHPRIHVLKPLGYRDFLYVMSRAYMILTDSGGIQEEAPSLHKPVIVLRNRTERPEAVLAGCAVLVGTEEKKIVALTERLLLDQAFYRRMTPRCNPFGDGKAGARIAAAVLHYFGLGSRPVDWSL